jgi:hypothetical protein
MNSRRSDGLSCKHDIYGLHSALHCPQDAQALSATINTRVLVQEPPSMGGIVLLDLMGGVALLLSICFVLMLIRPVLGYATASRKPEWAGARPLLS